jgi:hypothetical protein
MEQPIEVSKTIEYEDVNWDPDLRNRVVRYYYNLAKRKWLYNNKLFLDLVRYLRLHNNRPVLVASLADAPEHAPASEDERLVRQKLAVVRDYLISKRRIARVLESYSERERVKWWDLEDEEHHESILRALVKECERKIIKSIERHADLREARRKRHDE